MTQAEQWTALEHAYAPPAQNKGGRNAPLARVLEIARLHNVVSIYVERRYIDLDYRNEFSHFYSTTFYRFPSVAHRLHFFTAPVEGDLSNIASLQSAYRGYSVMRPLPFTPVGRTMLAPPPQAAGAVMCLAKDTIHIAGVPLTIYAAPFLSQDARYFRCAHSDLWMVLYHAYLRHGLPRRLPSDIHDAAVGGVVVGRQIPSEGLSQSQMFACLQNLQMSIAKFRLPETKRANKKETVYRLAPMICRYINSDAPVIVASHDHVWLVVGYRQSKSSMTAPLVFLRHDDARGPYLEVDDPWTESRPEHRPWSVAIAPLPHKVYMTADRAEVLAIATFERRAEQLEHEAEKANLLSQQAYFQTILSRLARRNDVTYRTFFTTSTSYKEHALSRLPNQIASAYAVSHWPRFVWVVELIDAAKRGSTSEGEVVLGEVIIDSTSDYDEPRDDSAILAVRIAGEAFTASPDFRETHKVSVVGFSHAVTGCEAATDSDVGA